MPSIKEFLCYYELLINSTNDTQYYLINKRVVYNPLNFFFYDFWET